MKYTLITLAALSGSAFAQTVVYSNNVDDDGSWSTWTNGGIQWQGPIAGLSPTAGNQILHHNPDTGNGVTSHGFNLSSSGSFDFQLDVGNFVNAPFAPPTSIDILDAGGTVLGSLTGNAPASATWTTWNTNLNVAAGSYSIRITAPQGSTTSINSGFDNFRVVKPVPEPSSAALLGLGGLALILRRRK